MPNYSNDIQKYLDGKIIRSELIPVQCNGCGARVQIRTGNREYKGQVAAGFPVTVYCIPCADHRKAQGMLVPAMSGIPRCTTCGTAVTLGTHGGVLYGECDHGCKSGFYFAEVENDGRSLTDPPAVFEAVVGLLEIMDELSDSEGNLK